MPVCSMISLPTTVFVSWNAGRQCMNLTLRLPEASRSARFTWYGVSTFTRSSHTSFASPIETQTSVWMKSTPSTASAGSWVIVIGTNDVDIQLDLANADERLGLLLDRIINKAPNALVVVAQMVPTTNDSINERVKTYNAAIPGLVQTRAAAGKHIKIVDMYGAFTKNASFKTAYMNDTLHPKDAGYAVMANVWWEAIGTYLPAK